MQMGDPEDCLFSAERTKRTKMPRYACVCGRKQKMHRMLRFILFSIIMILVYCFIIIIAFFDNDALYPFIVIIFSTFVISIKQSLLTYFSRSSDFFKNQENHHDDNATASSS